MRLHELPASFAFDDLTLLPGPNEGDPSEVSLAVRLGSDLTLPFPVLSAAMPSVTELPMARALGEFGGLGVLHRFCAVETQCSRVRAVAQHVPDAALPSPALSPSGTLLAAASCDPRDHERAEALVAAGARVLFLDTPNPDRAETLAAVERLRKSTHAGLVIGSVVTADTARRYIEVGVDVLKVGLGSGALCSIRQSGGVGLAQASALEAVCEPAARHGIPVISDGGVRSAGDIVKALALGASAVMVGSLLSGCDEAPGERVERDGRMLKRVAGLTLSDFELVRPTGYPAVDAYLRTHEAPRVEGRSALVPASGPCHLTLLAWLRSIRTGIHLTGAKSVPALWSLARFARASASEVAEAARAR